MTKQTKAQKAVEGKVQPGKAYPADEALLAEYVRRVCYENPRAMLASPSLKSS